MRKVVMNEKVTIEKKQRDEGEKRKEIKKGKSGVNCNITYNCYTM